MSGAPPSGLAVPEPLDYSKLPKNFDPLAASADVLSTFGFAPMPHPVESPIMHALWRDMVMPTPGQTMRFVAIGRDRLFLDAERHHPLFSHSPVLTSHLRTSWNWSGGVATPSDGERFTRIWGRWTIGDVSGPASGAQPSFPEHRCSQWIGMGGHLAHAISLPQLGTSHSVSGEAGSVVKKNWSWVQWWCAEEMTDPFTIEGFRFEEGDDVICSITVESARRVLMHIRNVTRNVLGNMVWRPGSNTPADGKSANWIMERPGVQPQVGLPQPESLYPLANYGRARFTGCLAETASAPGPDPGTPRDLRGATLIRMADPDLDPGRSVVVSVPSRVDNTTLELTYSGP